jgi:hypothetical protein
MVAFGLFVSWVLVGMVKGKWGKSGKEWGYTYLCISCITMYALPIMSAISPHTLPSLNHPPRFHRIPHHLALSHLKRLIPHYEAGEDCSDIYELIEWCDKWPCICRACHDFSRSSKGAITRFLKFEERLMQKQVMRKCTADSLGILTNVITP